MGQAFKVCIVQYDKCPVNNRFLRPFKASFQPAFGKRTISGPIIGEFPAKELALKAFDRIKIPGFEFDIVDQDVAHF